MTGARIVSVVTRRPDLRFPLPPDFSRRLTGADVTALGRRGKYLTADLSTGETLVMHLGMSGRFTVTGEAAGHRPGDYRYAGSADPAHDHVVFSLDGRAGKTEIVYNDPRRFGFMDLADTAGLGSSVHFDAMGPEPLGEAFSALVLRAALKGRTAPLKNALLDQSVVAGLGNIYVCEALWRARLSPRRRAGRLSAASADRLRTAIQEVLREAIEAGGSSLRDFASSDGALGDFQRRFSVYGREGEPCPACGAPVRRFVQGGRSSFACLNCQK